MPDGYAYAADLVAGLKRVADFEISVAAYPETHPEAPSQAADLDNLKRKIDAGADRAITQFFFDVDVFFRFRDRAAAAGITVPIVPGILPVTNFASGARNSRPACGATIRRPGWPRCSRGSTTIPTPGRLVACHVGRRAMPRPGGGAASTEFHFYTLNRADLVFAICHMLGVRPAAVARGARKRQGECPIFSTSCGSGPALRRRHGHARAGA